nr:MAG TPA: hypothetical protein [Caudoviricetes sp.]
MIFDQYQDRIANVADSLDNLIPVDLGIDLVSQWAIVDQSMKQIVPIQTILRMDIADESNVVTSIIENGSFVSYNKVPLPSQIQMTVILDGLQNEQQTSLETLKKFRQGTDNVQIITPYETYVNMNLTAVRISRTAERGASRTFVDLTFEEIREVSVQTARFSNESQVKNASSVSQQNVGKVAATTQTDTQKVNTLELLSRITIGGDA